jgi:hypothetical protein
MLASPKKKEKKKEKKKKTDLISLCHIHVPNCPPTHNFDYILHTSLACKFCFVFGFFCSCSSYSTLLPLPVLLFFQQRMWKSSKEVVVGLHTCRNSGPGSHQLLPFFFFFFRRKVIFAASSTRTQTFVASMLWWSTSDQGLHNLAAGSIPPKPRGATYLDFIRAYWYAL